MDRSPLRRHCEKFAQPSQITVLFEGVIDGQDQGPDIFDQPRFALARGQIAAFRICGDEVFQQRLAFCDRSAPTFRVGANSFVRVLPFHGARHVYRHTAPAAPRAAPSI